MEVSEKNSSKKKKTGPVILRSPKKNTGLGKSVRVSSAQPESPQNRHTFPFRKGSEKRKEKTDSSTGGPRTAK